MGEVYRARDTKLKRDVAIKILPEEFSRDPERIARFHREARAIAAGKNVGVIGGPDNANLRDVDLSPDGKRVAGSRAVHGDQDVWLIDTPRGEPARVHLDDASDA